jgi:hypothetical protein
MFSSKMIMMKRWLTLAKLPWLISGIAVVIGLTTLGFYLFRSKPLVSESIRQQSGFAIFYPSQQNPYKVESDQLQYDPQAKVLHLTAQNAGQKLIITEQSAPPQFNDIQSYIQKLADSLNSYSNFTNTKGTVYLTRPKELNGGQSAMFIGQGTLMFVHPNKDLSDTEWKQFFSALQVAE